MDEFAELKESLKHISELVAMARELVSTNIEFGFDWKIDEFARLMSVLTPQMYGSRFQSYFINKFKLVPIKSSEGIGDYKDQFGGLHELKVSLITSTNRFLNFVQIRPWQNIAGYTGIALDITKEVTDVQVYMLPKFKMLQELEIMKATAAHGTKGANVSNNNVELRFSLRIDDKDPNWIRWQNYRVNHIELT